MLWLIALYTIIFTFLAWKNFRLAVLLLIAALPVYLIRFSIGPLPSTLLELHFGSIFLVWMLSKKLGSKPGKTLIDKETGQEVVVRQKHSFFFIDVKYWPAILIVLSIFGLIYGFWQK